MTETSSSLPPARAVLLLAGGQSAEHEVSLIGAKNVFSSLKERGHRVEFRVISKQGTLLNAAESEAALQSGVAEDGGEALMVALPAALQNCDVVFPLLHGPQGEDGTIQGLLSFFGVPFVGCGVHASALCMDKIGTKRVLEAAGFPQMPWREILRSDWQAAPEAAESLAAEVDFPMFVKPANMGSSVGIAKVKSEADLHAALQAAFEHDRRVIVEAAAGSGKPRELEVAVLGNESLKVSVAGELSFDAEFYDYSAKYEGAGAKMTIPADISADLATVIAAQAREAYRVLTCAGLARIDFFLTSEGDLYINEVNTMPGFTAMSMYSSLMAASGVGKEALFDELIDLAMQPRV